VTDADCAAREVCDTATGQCIGEPMHCTSNVDCPAGERCDPTTGLCTSGCLSDAECLPGEICDTATGACIGGELPAGCRQCACVDLLSMGGCADICKMGRNGTTTPNFCDGVAALPQCARCLADNCGGITSPPDPSNPSACL
jgi:Cys-rich repeat protein